MRKWTRRTLLLGLGVGAVAYGCTTRASQFTAIIEEKFPPIGQFIEVSDPQTGQMLRLHYDKRGSGPPVVLIHGASGNLRDFTFSLSDVLAAEGFTAIAFDRPGFGYSDRANGQSFMPSAQAAVLRAGLDAIGVKRPIVMGHSFGGAVATAWAVDAPETIRGAVMLAGLTYPWPAGDNAYHAAASTAVFGPPINALVRNRALKSGAERAVAWVFKPQQPPLGYAGYIGAELASRPKTFRENGRDITNINEAMEKLIPRYPSINVPIELIHGTEDAILPIEAHARRFKAALMSANLTELKGVGHMAHHAAPKELVAAAKRIRDKR